MSEKTLRYLIVLFTREISILPSASRFHFYVVCFINEPEAVRAWAVTVNSTLYHYFISGVSNETSVPTAPLYSIHTADPTAALFKSPAAVIPAKATARTGKVAEVCSKTPCICVSKNLPAPIKVHCSHPCVLHAGLAARTAAAPVATALAGRRMKRNACSVKEVLYRKLQT